MQDALHQHWILTRISARFSGVPKAPDIQFQLNLPHALVSSRQVSDLQQQSVGATKAAHRH